MLPSFDDIFCVDFCIVDFCTNSIFLLFIVPPFSCSSLLFFAGLMAVIKLKTKTDFQKASLVAYKKNSGTLSYRLLGLFLSAPGAVEGMEKSKPSATDWAALPSQLHAKRQRKIPRALHRGCFCIFPLANES
uniref:Uncharacterized protein n=1 Tax=Sphaerodactylus townsendi TaxID=933632 RepID=A0ACB8E5Q8_9SAUR